MAIKKLQMLRTNSSPGFEFITQLNGEDISTPINRLELMLLHEEVEQLLATPILADEVDQTRSFIQSMLHSIRG